MKNKAFTLVELLAVLVVLAIIMSIVIVSVNNIISNSEKSVSKIQVKKIEDAARIYYLKEGRTQKNTCISVDELKNKGYIESKEIKDPETGDDMQGYVKISNSSNKYSYEYQENPCKVYELLSGTAGEYGAKYSIKVNKNDTFIFYVVGKNADGTTNLILERNICSDGTLATETNTCLVALVTKEDYTAYGGKESDYTNSYGNVHGSITKGPITAMKYVKQATDGWTYIEPYPTGTVYNDENGKFTNFSYAGYRARLPFLSEVGDAKLDGSNTFLYDYFDNYDSWDTSKYGPKPKNNIKGILAYWLFSSSGDNLFRAHRVLEHGYLNPWSIAMTDENGSLTYSLYGVRPVITLKLQ